MPYARFAVFIKPDIRKCENLQKELLGRRREAKRLKKIILKNNNSYIHTNYIVIVVAIYDIKLSFRAMLFHRFIISKTTMYFSIGGGRYSPHHFAAR